MSGTSLRIGPASALILSIVALTSAVANAQTWTGGGADDLWSDGVNWSSNPNPPANNGSAPIVFAGTTRLTPDVDTPWDVLSINFASGAGTFMLHDSTLTIEGGGVTNNSTNVQTIGNSVVLGAPQTWNAASGNLTFGSTVNLNGNLLTIDGPDNTTVNGAISGAGGLTKNGAGTLTLNAVNTFTGTFTINAGTVTAGIDNALPDIAYNLTGGTLNLNGHTANLGAVTQSGSSAITTGAGTVNIASLSMSGTSSFDTTGGNTTVGSLSGSSSTTNITLGSNGTLTDTTTTADTYAGTITSSGGTFVLNSTGGTGNLTLTGNNVNTFGSGNVTITSGTLTSGAANSLPVANYSVDGTLNVNNNSVTALQLTSTGTAGQITLGTGSITIANPGTSTYQGSVSGGNGSSIAMDSGNQTISGTVSGGTAVTANGGTLTLSGTNTYTGGTTLNTGGTVSVSSDDNLGGASSAITFSGGTLEVTGTTLTSLATTHTINTSTFNGGFDIDNAANTFTVSQNLSGTGALSKSGDGTLLLSGTNTYSGGTTVTDGTLEGTTTSIQGNITATTPGIVDFNQTTNGTYAGAITGTGNVQLDGTGTVTFTGTNNYSGTTTINDGTLQIGNGTAAGALGTGNVIDNSVGGLVFDRPDTVTAANNISGSGSVTQNGTGLLTLSGTSNYSGNTTVNAGQLNVDGSITSSTTVAAGATLGGIGTISNNVSNSGTLTPGNATNKTGTLSVTGNYTFAASGTTMNVSVDDTAAQNVGKLAVTGTATLDNSKLHIDLSSGNFDKTGTTQYTVLTAGAIGGSFASADTTSLFVKANLTQEATDVFFTLTQSFNGVGTTFNEVQVGNYLTNNAANTNTDFQAVLTALSGISNQAQAAAALAQISGDIHPTIAQLNITDTTLVIGNIAARLRAAPFTPGGPLAVADAGSSSHSGSAPIALVSADADGDPEFQTNPDSGSCNNCGNHWAGWAMGFGMGGSATTDGNATGGSFGMGGVVAGMERWEDDCHLVGVYGAYVGSDFHATNDQTATINGGQFGSYVFADDGFNYYTLLGGFEFDGDTTNRALDINTLTSSNTSNYSDWQGFLYAERGVSFQGCNYVVQPFAAVQYIFLRQNSFTENGGTNTALDLSGSGDTTNSLRSMVGARVQYAMMNHDGRRTLPEIHAMWLHEYLDADTSLNATMVPIGGAPFIVRGLDMGRDWGVVGASFTWEMLGGWAMSVNYDLQTNTQTTLNAGSGSLGYRW